MNQPKHKFTNSWVYWQCVGILVALLTLFLWDVIMLPFIPEKHLEAAVSNEISERAMKHKLNYIEYHDANSIMVRNLHIAREQEFAIAAGIISSDMQTLAFHVLLKELPILGGFLYDTSNERANDWEVSEPLLELDADYLIFRYKLVLNDGVLSKQEKCLNLEPLVPVAVVILMSFAAELRKKKSKDLGTYD